MAERRAGPLVLAVSSGGGHWIELLRLRPALEGRCVHFVTVNAAYANDIENNAPGTGFSTIRDATRWHPVATIVVALQLLRLVIKLNPRIVLTTGAAPGFLALAIGKLIGAKTIWVDSIANVDELSASGRLAGRFADLWLTQWEHLARDEGPTYAGKVL